MVKGNEQLERRLGAVLVIATLVTYSYFFHFHDRWPNPNETTRLYSAISMAEDGDFSINRQIDRYGVIWDRAEHNGKLYSDKAPGLSMLASLPLAALHAGAKMLGREPSLAVKHWVARFFPLILPSSFFILLLFVYLRRFLPDPYLRAGLLFVYANGTPAATFSTLFFGHQLSAVLLFTAFVLIDDRPQPTLSLSNNVEVGGGEAEAGGHRSLWLSAALAGLLLGLAAVTEYPTAPAGAVVFLYALTTWKEKRPLLLAVLTGAIPVAFWLVYNKVCFGAPLSVGYSHLDSSEFARVHAKGLLGVTLPSAVAFGGTFFGPQRGLFFFSPVCAFGFVGLAVLWKEGFKRQALLVGTLALMFIYITSSFGYWIGGDVVGPRHLIPLVPFLLIPMASFLGGASDSGSRWSVVLFLALGLISVVMITASTIPFPFFPTPFVNPFRDLAVEFWRRGFFPYNAGRLFGLKGMYSVVPYLLFFGVLTSAAIFWITHRHVLDKRAELYSDAVWRRGIVTRAAPLVCLWFAIVLNAVPSQVSESTYNEQQRELSVYDPAGEDFMTLRIDALNKTGKSKGTDAALLDAATGRTAEALEIYRWTREKEKK